MDQLEYYLQFDEDFKSFLTKNNLNFDEDSDIKYKDKDKQKMLLTHIENLHTLIFKEISKKGIANQFLFDLRKEINNFNSKY